jgi:hypothetical protein
MKYYTIYRIINKINGRFYIGKHITENPNDNYMGSGTLIRKAIAKYGIENFEKQIIQLCEDESQMNDVENSLISPDDEMSYNLNSGGKGGWSYVNQNRLSHTDESVEKRKTAMMEYWTENKKRSKSEQMINHYITHGAHKQVIGTKKRYEDEAFLQKFKSKMSEVNGDENKRKAASEKIKEKWKNDPNFRDKMKTRKPRGSDGSALKEKWNDPVWRNNMLESRKNKRKQNEAG